MTDRDTTAIRKGWYTRAKEQTVETLPAFMAELTEYPKHEYRE